MPGCVVLRVLEIISSIFITCFEPLGGANEVVEGHVVTFFKVIAVSKAPCDFCIDIGGGILEHAGVDSKGKLQRGGFRRETNIFKLCTQACFERLQNK